MISPIVEITAQYMEYVDQMKKDNLDTLSEFLVMAATLLDIKSKMLLPKKEEEEQEQEDPKSRACAAAAWVQDVQVHGKWA